MTSGTFQRRLRAGVVLTLLAGLLIATGLGDPPAHRAPAPAAPQLDLAADASQFRAGNIISDGLFFDGLAMNAGDVQAFIADKNRACVPGARPCLRDFRQNTENLPADSYCRGYAGAPGETPGSIIAKVGESCGISQRVLLVVMQKEQSLLTASDSYLTDRRYAAAMGFKCPDSTAPYCDPMYAGFQRQVYYAARQYKVYAATPDRWNYKAGRWNSILYHPNESCGRGDVFIENQATAGLYIYTPYQPNAGALAAGYGTAPCGAYGNRNFWLYFTDWFGSTQSPGGTAILAREKAAGSSLGTATSGVICGLVADGCFRAYQQGTVYWSPASGARIVRGAIGGKWGQLGWEYGTLGYPTGEERCGLRNSGCFQTFQRGSIYFTPGLGAWSVKGAIYARWAKQAWERGSLGYPKRDEVCGLVGGGCFQAFEGGNVYWTRTTGARIVSAPVLARWGAQNYEKGALGYPVGDTTCGLRDSGCYQLFRGGSVYSSATNGVFVVASGAVRDKWAAQQWERGPLGYPVGDTRCGLADSGCYQDFEHGAVYSSASTGARAVLDGPVRDKWAAQQWERGPLGYPVGDTRCGLADSGCYQEFRGGAVYSSTSTGAHVVTGAIRQRWAAQQWERGPLGYPTGDQVCGLVRQGCYQTFQHGLVYTTPTTGARIVSGAFLTEWADQTHERGPLGYPTTDQRCGLPDGGCYQHFEGGSLYSSTATGLHTVLTPLRDAWAAQRWERGPLGYPTADQVCGLPDGGCSQQFQGGSIIWTAGTGARAMTGQIGGYWASSGAQGGSLGYPTGNQVCGLVDGGCFQQFQGGSVYWTAGTGAHTVSGPIYTAWSQQSWERGALGYPTADATTSGSETTQAFQHGTLVLDTTTGRVTTRR